MKSEVYKFDPVIYPEKLWVVKNPDVAEIERLFFPFNNDGELCDSFGTSLSDSDGKYANTIIVADKANGDRGCLISLLCPKGCGAGVCSHEALHYVALVGEELGIELGNFDKSEPMAYLEQWATNCIWSVLVGRPEKMNGVLCNKKEAQE